jgi:predicted metal-binding membrane protein
MRDRLVRAMTQPRHDRLPISAIALAWAVTVAASVGGWRHEMGHDHLVGGGGSLMIGAAVFVIAWLVMIAAMMLPASLPTLRWFTRLDGVAGRQLRLTGAFLAGYGLTWAGIGLTALAGDMLLHEVSHGWTWLAGRPWLIAACALALAGASQVAAWSRRHRPPAPAHVRSWVRGPVDAAGARRLGREHAAIRLRRCWPVMLLSFAFGMTSLPWMIVLTVLMVAEGSPRFAARTALVSGVGFLGAAFVLVAQPGWVPV